jgi:transposase-like protein
VEVVRYRCKSCRRTFTARPDGVSRSSKSLRVQGLAVMMWCMGLSFDAVVSVMRGLGVPLAKSTACGYVAKAGAAALRLRRKAERRKIRFAGMDTTVFKVKGRKVIAAFVTDALRGDTVAIEFVDGEDAGWPGKGERASPRYRMRMLLTELVERGPQLFSHKRHRAEGGRYRLDGTNNVTERAIGLDGKWRHKTMRGGKSRRALRRTLNLHAHIRQRTLARDGPLDTSILLAA